MLVNIPGKVPLNIALHANQQLIHDTARKHMVGLCGKRFGKSKLGIYRMLQRAGQLPNGTVWAVAPFFSQAKSIIWWELLNLLPPQLIRRKIETDLFLELWNGCKIQLRGADHEDSLRGPHLDHLLMDEAAFCKEHVWPAILRGQLLGNVSSGTADFISSPNPRGRNWFSTFHAEAMKKMKAGDPDWSAYFFTIRDNPTLPVEDIDKLEAGIPEDTWNREYMAQESDYSGVIYSEFDYANHAKEIAIDNSWSLVRGLDWGISHPTACIWIYVNKALRIAYVCDEFMKSGLVIEESSGAIKQITANRTVEWSVIDPSTAKRNSQTGRRDMDEFIRCGVGCTPGDNRDRGYDITKMFFKKNMLFIHPKCRNLIGQLRTLQYGDKTSDDMTDCLRYACVRIHDFMFGGNLFPTGEASPVSNKVGIFNMNDFIFNKSKSDPQDRSWANCETEEAGEAA